MKIQHTFHFIGISSSAVTTTTAFSILQDILCLYLYIFIYSIMLAHQCFDHLSLTHLIYYAEQGFLANTFYSMKLAKQCRSALTTCLWLKNRLYRTRFISQCFGQNCSYNAWIWRFLSYSYEIRKGRWLVSTGNLRKSIWICIWRILSIEQMAKQQNQAHKLTCILSST